MPKLGFARPDRNGWNWLRCTDWRERVCRLRSPLYRAVFVAYEMQQTHENFVRAAKAALTIIKMAKTRNMQVREMIVRDMPEVAEYLGF